MTQMEDHSGRRQGAEQSMATELRPEVYKRIVLAKFLHEAGATACTVKHDQMAFSKGLLLLHDAVEAALGAVADHVHAMLRGNTYLLEYYNLIDKAKPLQRVPYRAQMRNLNALRNNIKHLGILPDTKANAHFPDTVRAILEEVCEDYLELDYAKVSLKGAIANETVLSRIIDAESALDKGSIEDALIGLAYAMYHICEYRTGPSPFSDVGMPTDEIPPVRFPSVYATEFTVTLLEYGVDPYAYHHFKNLTPMIGQEEGQLVYWWNKHYGHPANWTPDNARFCLSFCIDTALKFQAKEDSLGITLTYYSQVFEDLIEPVKERAVFWDQSSKLPPLALLQAPKKREPVFILEAGGSIVGVAHDSQDRLDEWFVISTGIPSKSGGLGFGFVDKEEVRITRRSKAT